MLAIICIHYKSTRVSYDSILYMYTYICMRYVIYHATFSVYVCMTIMLTYTHHIHLYRHYLESQLAVAWGGRVAEELVFGQSKVRIMTLYNIYH